MAFTVPGLWARGLLGAHSNLWYSGCLSGTYWRPLRGHLGACWRPSEDHWRGPIEGLLGQLSGHIGV
eukprot:2375857-Pyramimonas_sp.AAC.1